MLSTTSDPLMCVRTFMDIKPTKIACILAPQSLLWGVGRRDVAQLGTRHVDIGPALFYLSAPDSCFFFSPGHSYTLLFSDPVPPHSRTAVREGLWQEAKLGFPPAVTPCGHPGKQHTVKLLFVSSVYLPVNTDFPALTKATFELDHFYHKR